MTFPSDGDGGIRDSYDGTSGYSSSLGDVRGRSERWVCHEDVASDNHNNSAYQLTPTEHQKLPERSIPGRPSVRLKPLNPSLTIEFKQAHRNLHTQGRVRPKVPSTERA